MLKNMNFIEKLRETGLRPTKQRVKICEILFNREKTFHFTINDLAKKISEELKKKYLLQQFITLFMHYKKKDI